MMYVPASFGVSDQGILDAFIRRYAFATLVTSSSGGLIASHIPIMLRRNEGRGSLVGHVARANDHWRELGGSQDSLAIFHDAFGEPIATADYGPGAADQALVARLCEQLRERIQSTIDRLLAKRTSVFG